MITKDFGHKQHVAVDVSGLPEGIYMLKIQSKSGIEVKKLVIHR
jgi:hypothetical protein